MKIYEPHSSSLSNIDANVLALCCYLTQLASPVPFLSLIIWAVPLIIFLVEKNSDFVRQHAMQAFIVQIFFNVVVFVVSFVSGFAIYLFDSSFFSVIGNLLVLALRLISFALSIIGAVSAFQYKEASLPLFGALVQKLYKPL